MAGSSDGRWALAGEAIIAFVGHHRAVHALPAGFHRLPGPVVVVAQRFDTSPVGPYLCLAVGEPVLLGLRPGYFFGTVVIDVPEARKASRSEWGFPTELGTLRWHTKPDGASLSWEERSIDVTAEVRGRPLPMLLPVRSVQRRADGQVIVPSRVRGIARRSLVRVDLPSKDPLGALRGEHVGFRVSGMSVRRGAARRPLGLLSSFRAPLRPEPGVLGMQRDQRVALDGVPVNDLGRAPTSAAPG